MREAYRAVLAAQDKIEAKEAEKELEAAIKENEEVEKKQAQAAAAEKQKEKEAEKEQQETEAKLAAQENDRKVVSDQLVHAHHTQMVSVECLETHTN